MAGAVEVEGLDYRLPLRKLSVSAITDVRSHASLLTAINPKLAGFRLNDYEVNGGLSDKAASLDDDVSVSKARQ